MSQKVDALPVAARTFSRTERLLIRVPAYGPGNTTPIVTARLLNRRSIPMRELQIVDAPLPPGTVQFDLPLASLAPDEYRVELAACEPDRAQRRSQGNDSIPRYELSRVILHLRIPC